MLELGFGVSDLARTTFGLSPMDQLLGGVAGAGHRCAGSSIRRDRWWRQARPNVPRKADCLLDLVNASFEAIPDFLCAEGGTGHRTLADELDAMLAVPEDLIREAVAFYGDGPQLPPVVRRLREEGSKALRQLAAGAWALFQSCLAADWPDIQRLLDADVARHSSTSAQDGPGAMLARLHPHGTWYPDGVLRLDLPGWDHRADLGGRGLDLRPNVFLTSVTIGPVRHRGTAMLYPARVPQVEPGARTVDGLAALVGPSRARALRAIGQEPCSTAQLSTRLGLSAPTASAHATALRAAGMITTRREGQKVRHALTPLGHELLATNPERVTAAFCYE